MKKYFIIKNNQVSHIEELAEKPENGIEVTDENKSFINPILNNNKIVEGATPEEIEAFQKKEVPLILTPRQFWLSVFKLKSLKKSDALDFIETLPEPPREMAKITIIEAIEFVRNDEMLNNLSSQFGWSKNDLDEIFIYGDTL
jgi:hypothetical protein